MGELWNTHRSALESYTTGSFVLESIDIAFRKFMNGLSAHESIDEFIDGHRPREFIPHFFSVFRILMGGVVRTCKTKSLSS